MLVAKESNLKMNLMKKTRIKLRAKMELSIKMNLVPNQITVRKLIPICNNNTPKKNWHRCKLIRSNNNKKLTPNRCRKWKEMIMDRKDLRKKHLKDNIKMSRCDNSFQGNIQIKF